MHVFAHVHVSVQAYPHVCARTCMVVHPCVRQKTWCVHTCMHAHAHAHTRVQFGGGKRKMQSCAHASMVHTSTPACLCACGSIDLDIGACSFHTYKRDPHPQALYICLSRAIRQENLKHTRQAEGHFLTIYNFTTSVLPGHVFGMGF